MDEATSSLTSHVLSNTVQSRDVASSNDEHFTCLKVSLCFSCLLGPEPAARGLLPKALLFTVRPAFSIRDTTGAPWSPQGLRQTFSRCLGTAFHAMLTGIPVKASP